MRIDSCDGKFILWMRKQLEIQLNNCFDENRVDKVSRSDEQINSWWAIKIEVG